MYNGDGDGDVSFAALMRPSPLAIIVVSHRFSRFSRFSPLSPFSRFSLFALTSPEKPLPCNDRHLILWVSKCKDRKRDRNIYSCNNKVGNEENKIHVKKDKIYITVI